MRQTNETKINSKIIKGTKRISLYGIDGSFYGDIYVYPNRVSIRTNNIKTKITRWYK